MASGTGVENGYEGQHYGLGYQKTLMYGRYSRQLGEYAKLEALRQAEKKRIKEQKARTKEESGYKGKLKKSLAFIWRNTSSKLGEDWVFIGIVGIVMAVVSYVIDVGVDLCNNARVWLYHDLTRNIGGRYATWVGFTVCLILFSSGFAQIVSPQAVGSGIPEMKTILRGIVLKEYLTFKTLVAKLIGLIATLGSGLPLGKEGPFVHIASIVAACLGRAISSFKGIAQNKSRNTEMLAAACAVGIASCFAAPVGGVLFSIEVTSVYFAVRNYWRGFFGSVCAAAFYRLLSVWFNQEDSVTALFKTSFTMDLPFDSQELFVFALMGVICGLAGACYVWLHRKYVTFIRSNKIVNGFLQKNRLLYPGIVSFIVSSVSFPLGLGQFVAGELTTHEQITSLLSNFTWTSENLTVEERDVLKHWTTPNTGVLISLVGYLLFSYVFSMICYTIPVPCGNFVPVFKIGAAFGRLVGELMHMWFSTGIKNGSKILEIVPGGYAAVGAAAFTGAVTHSISVSVIVFEVTGQITHIIPVMIAVLIANGIASLLFMSIYESIILIKKLPYLPDFLPSSNNGMYNVCVGDFMVREVKYIYYGITYENLERIMHENVELSYFPLVDNPQSMLLLGTMQRVHLDELIEQHIGRERRLEYATLRELEAEERALQETLRRVELRERRPSRFQVSTAADTLAVKQASDNHLDTDQSTPQPSEQKKSILKKSQSLSSKAFSPLMSSSSSSTPYTTVTGAESKIRIAFGDIFKRSAQLQNGDDYEMQYVLDMQEDRDGDSPTGQKKVQLPNDTVCDMSPEDKLAWEDEQMLQQVDFSGCHIDPAPFQLVEKTPLLKVHSLFSMVGMDHAYVTAIGKLVGVVGLTELRKAIEDANNGSLPPPTIRLHRHSLSCNHSINAESTRDANESESEVTVALMAKESEA